MKSAWPGPAAWTSAPERCLGQAALGARPDTIAPIALISAAVTGKIEVRDE